MDPNAMKDLKLRVGETIKYDLPISGEPIPDMTWTASDKVLKPSNRCKITVERKRTILKVSSALEKLTI